MLVHRSPLVLVVVFVLLALPASAKDTLIDAHTPYSNGVVALRYSDTVSFSTGIRLIGVQLCSPVCDEVSASAVGYRGIAYGSVGMRWVPGVTRPVYCVVTQGIANSPDSVWDAIGTAPDSIVPMDTLTIGMAHTLNAWLPAGLILREWICYGVVLPPTSRSGWVPDWNIIAYAHCPDSSHMAFQFAYDTVLGGPTGQVVRWAVDSAGNGVFKISPVAVAPGAVREPTELHQRLGRTASSGSTLFDLRGKRIGAATARGRETGTLRAGVYIRADAAGAVRLVR